MCNINTPEKELTGYPSIDKPWLKYYSEEAINAPLPECTIYEYLWENNKDHLDDAALIYFGKKITYGELFEDIDKAACAFLALGLKAGDVCTVVSISCVNSVVVFYALNKIGAISNYINAIASEDEFRTYFSEARSKCVVTLDLFAEKVIKSLDASVTKNVVAFSLADYMPKMASIGYKLKFPKINLEYADCIMWCDFISKSTNSESYEFKHSADTVSIWAHTGGTTGFPKTVLLTDKAYNTVVMQYMQSMKHKRGEVFLNIIIPFVVYGMLTCLHMPLCLGLTVAIIPKFEAKDWKKYITMYHPNHIAGIPSYYSPMLIDPNIKSIDLSEIVTFAAGGDGLNEQLENDLNVFLRQHGSKAQLIKGYGMTEVCSSAVTAFGDYSKIGSVGIPLAKNNIKAYDADKKCECKYGEVGEIMLSSPSLMVCYKDNDKETHDLISVKREMPLFSTDSDNLNLARFSECAKIPRNSVAAEYDTDVISILFSSGTSSTMKGVMVTYRSMLEAQKKQEYAFGIKPGDKYLLALPVHHMAGYSSMISFMLTGCQIAVVEKMNSVKLQSAFQEYEPNYFGMVPKVYDAIADKIIQEIDKKWRIVSALVNIFLNFCGFVRRTLGLKIGHVLLKSIYSKAFGKQIVGLAVMGSICKPRTAYFPRGSAIARR